MNGKSTNNNEKKLNSDFSEREEMYSIGEASRLTGSTIKTIRYYDEIELLKPAWFTEGGHRLYSIEKIKRLELIHTLRYLDFGIEDIRKLLSGESQVAKALDFQIEVLETQVKSLVNMITILRGAKEKGIDEDSLCKIHHLVDSFSANVAEQKKYVYDKMEEMKIFDDVPLEWRYAFLHLFQVYILKDGKITARRTAIWNEIKELLNDPEFITVIRYRILPMVHMQQNSTIDVAVWKKKYQIYYRRLVAASQEKLSAESNVVQTIINDIASLVAKAGQSPDTVEYFQQFLEYLSHSVTDLTERFDTLCSLLNPEWKLLTEANTLLFSGVQCKLSRLKET
ncbi:MerR family transcriptional regulator [Brevibacillus brevis]|uniref:MerR family transcriptional regulator n=1 Tax=Brevibacillus brevis TaxID=1393 RepID=UPI001643F579|nr:MerR family transcriptional regulator [Brevibacillus brevis]